MGNDVQTSTMTAPTLDYAPAPPRRRKWIRRGILLALLLTATYSGWRWGGAGWRHAQILYFQRQCMTYTAPPDQVVYEEEPTAAATLLAASKDYAPYPIRRRSNVTQATAPLGGILTAATHAPACCKQFEMLVPMFLTATARPTSAVIFLHERKLPSGERRFVCVRLFPETDTFTPSFIEGYNYESRAIVPATLSTPPTMQLGVV
ncbi:MAG TPA: hypothetical protein VH518_08240, partial [Tepidisphaeraceae bacterium]